MGISDRGTKAKTITSCDNAFVTNILLLPLRCTALSHKKHLLPRRPQEALLCAKAKRQQQMFYLCESGAAAIVLSVRKRSGSNCFICAKAERQQLFYLCESGATATTKRPAGTEINPLVLPKSHTLIDHFMVHKPLLSCNSIGQ
ncbi:hypothetical protein ACQKMI_16380 [Lysinibacillus sp. NPDC097214]|uniref:hypothetical protein n=1 Tax=Lysinibacillus sp. NPDC097214 TaxID=3390584 RepID=UPI003D0639AD